MILNFFDKPIDKWINMDYSCISFIYQKPMTRKSSQGMRPQRAGGAENPAEMQLGKWTMEGDVNGHWPSIRDVSLRYRAENVLAFS